MASTATFDDSDYDDLVIEIAIIPFPAGGLLLLTTLEYVTFARRKKGNA